MDAVKEFGIRVKDGSKGTNEAMAELFAPDDIDDFIGALNMGGTKTKEFTELAEKMGGVEPAKDLVAALQKGGTGAEKAYTSILNQMSAGGDILDGVATGALKGTDAMSQIVEKLMSMDNKTDQARLGVALFGTQWEDMEADTIAALTNIGDSFDQTKDTIGEITKIKYSTLGQAFRGIGRQLQTTFILPLVDAALPALSAFSNWFASAIPKVKEFFSSFGGRSEIGDIFKELKLGNFSESVEDSMHSVLKSFGLDSNTANQAVASFKKVFEMVQKAATTFKNFITPVINNVKTAFLKGFTVVQEIIKRLIPVFVQVGGIIVGAAGRIIAALAPVVAYVVNTIGPIIGKVIGFIGTEVIPRLVQAFQKILPAIQGVANAIGPLMSAIWGFIKPIIDNIVDAFNFAWPFVKSIVVTAIDVISGVIGGLMTTLEGVITFVTGVFSGNWAQAWEGIKGIFSGVWEGIKSIAIGSINGVIRIINNGISKINGLSFDLPEVFGGGHVGLSIPSIPEIGGGGSSKILTGSSTNQSRGGMQAFARGGYADTASIFGEAGGEWAIPDRRTPRSMQLLDQANKSLGYKGGGGNITVEYSPQVVIQGKADKQVVQTAMRDSYREFEMNYARMTKQKGRLAFGG